MVIEQAIPKGMRVNCRFHSRDGYRQPWDGLWPGSRLPVVTACLHWIRVSIADSDPGAYAHSAKRSGGTRSARSARSTPAAPEVGHFLGPPPKMVGLWAAGTCEPGGSLTGQSGLPGREGHGGN